ncbi:nucleic acid/nucleotide deaminase of polymorphic system toxin [Actinocrispum wychmicini]|uniref:Nucleic acid/nucleotide deaminase of polymorphic system toxin n=1 Tax=Actinocrispum wychmicini TaxID=1213861 RepID=A0A4R2IWE6_9PSEU|nr:nucleic acid/nucleotide deaminase of polymorphic system toxin [Actinocrispum wychmicini]
MSASITNSHGDSYPPQAAGLVENLPQRVTPSAQERTVGVTRIGDRVLPPIMSGYDPVFSELACRRLAAIGIDPAMLKSHVEVKLAALMIDTGQTQATVAINYTPCGFEVRRFAPDTCHRVLDDMLPPGYTLTVYGTTQDNAPFEWTYGRRNG